MLKTLFGKKGGRLRPPSLKQIFTRRLSRLHSFLYIELTPVHRQLAMYTLIGCSSVAVDATMFLLLKMIIHYQIANIISMHLGMINSFVRNAKYTFKKRDRIRRRFGMFYCIGLCGIGLAAAVLYLCIDVLGLPALLSKIITILVVWLSQFTANRHLSFK